MFPVAYTIGTDFRRADAAAARVRHLLGVLGQPPVNAVPPLLRPRSSDEYAPVPWDARLHRAAAVATTAAADARLGSPEATAAPPGLACAALDAVAGGGFYPSRRGRDRR